MLVNYASFLKWSLIITALIGAQTEKYMWKKFTTNCSGEDVVFICKNLTSFYTLHVEYVNKKSNKISIVHSSK